MAVGEITQTEFGPITEIAPPVVAASPASSLAPEQAGTIDPATGAVIPPGAKLIKLTPEQELQEANPGAKIVGPRDLDEDALYDLADKQQFSIPAYLKANPDALQDDNLRRKLGRVNARVRDRGFEMRDIFSTPEDPEPGVIGGAWNAIKKGGTGLAHFGEGLAMNAANLMTIIPAVGAAITPGGVTPKQALEAAQKASAEAFASMEGGEMGVIGGVASAGKKLGSVISGKRNIDKSEAEQHADLLGAVDKENLREARVHAQGPFTQAIGGEIIKDLEAKGIGPEAERIEAMTGTDPASMLMFGKVFSPLHKATTAIAPLVRPVEKAISEVSKKAVGLSASTAGIAGQIAAKPIEVLAKPAGIAVGATKGAILGGPGGLLGGAYLGKKGGQVIAGAAKSVGEAAKTTRQFGAEVAGLSPLESTAALGTRAVLDAFPKFLTATAEGAGIDLAFIAATAETPEEAGAMPLLGTAFGAGKGALGATRQFAISAKFAPDFWKHPDKWAAPFTPDNSFSGLAELHKATLESAPETQTARVNAANNFLRQQKSDAPVYFINDEAGLASALEQIYSRQGVPEAAKRAQFAAKQNGMFTENIVDDAGKPRRVIIAKNPDSIPHESFHGIQAVLGEAGNRPIDLMTFKAYEDVWDAEGRDHASQLTGKQLPEGADWRQVIRDTTGTEKADVYLARELAAENFDYLFRAGIDRPKGLPGKLADVILSMTELFGTSPLVGERSPVLGVEPKLELVEGIRRLVSPEKVTKKSVGKLPTAPAPVEKAKAWVEENPTGIPERDAAVNAMADAVNTGQGVTVLYWGAKGEPAGSIASVRPERRAQIEKQRGAENKDRALVNKVIFPYKVENTSKGPQFVGWSPDNFAANTAKFEAWLGSAEKTKPGASSNVPYEFDTAAGRLSTAGKAALDADLQTFISNQRAGATGAGEVLTVPPEVIARGFTQPEQVGTPVPLEQSKADLINYLFNVQIPESVSRVAPLHLAGQEISAATAPGRTEVPVRPRGQYAEEKLAKAGIPGPREVLEVNPFRQWVEQTSADSKIMKPSLIEVSQRLNVPRIEESSPVSASTPAFGGNILTLASGFQPAAETARSLISMSVEEWKSITGGYKGKLGGGLTGWAFDLGAAAKDISDVMALRESAAQLSELSKAISIAEEGGFDRKMELIGRAQAAREAFEAATGSNLEGTGAGSSVSFIQKHIDPNYEPPVPAISEKTQFQPKRALPNSAGTEDFKVVHYSSNNDLKRISPKFFGKGKATSKDLRGGPKSYFFIEGQGFGQDSALFKNAGLSAYETTISGSRLYDLREGKPDELNWRSTINREEADANIRGAGYTGIILDTEDGRQVVAMFKPVKVKPSKTRTI